MNQNRQDIPALYLPQSLDPDDIIRLPDEESRHVRALRLRRDDPVLLLDGQGRRTDAVIESIENRGSTVRIVRSVLDEAETRPYIVLAVGLLDDRSRFEWLVEKAVELGAAELAPMRTRRSEGHFNAERTMRIAIAALKQSRRSYLPKLHEPRSFDALVKSVGDPGFLCHESAPTDHTLARRLLEDPAERLLLLIGPEGGFAPEEVEFARKASIQVVSLGRNRLRAETAAMAALTLATQLGTAKR